MRLIIYQFIYYTYYLCYILYIFIAGGYPGRKNAVVPGGGELFLQVLKQHPEILQQILSTVLNVIMFEDCRNQWSMSRPLLGLILLNEEVSLQLFHLVYFIIIIILS